MIAGTVWSGTALICVIAVFVRFFQGWSGGWRRYAVAFALLGVTGLDIIPFLGRNLATRDVPSEMLPMLEWWNEMVTGFSDAMLWVPHHIAALVTGLLALLLVWEETNTESRSARLVPMLFAAMALASTVGLSVDLGFVFGVSLAVWFLFLGWRKEFAAALATLVVAAVAGTLVAPFCLELLAGGPPARSLSLTVRDFSLLPRTSDPFLKAALRLATLPLNYGMELGFFLYAAAIHWRLRWRSALARPDRPVVLLLLTSFFIATFLLSRAGNDLNLRALLPAQFILLLWAAQVLDLRRHLGAVDRGLLTLLLVIGASGAALNLVSLRFFPLFEDSALFARLEGGVNRDHLYGRTSLSIAQAYSWIRQRTNRSAVLQSTPETLFNYGFGLYSDRRGLAMGVECDAYSGRVADCKAIKAALRPLFTGPAGSNDFVRVCRAFPLDYVVVQMDDPVWASPSSWIWKEQPVFANACARVFACRR